jgi:hypothetical protein
LDKLTTSKNNGPGKFSPNHLLFSTWAIKSWVSQAFPIEHPHLKILESKWSPSERAIVQAAVPEFSMDAKISFNSSGLPCGSVDSQKVTFFFQGLSSPGPWEKRNYVKQLERM